MNEWTSNNRVRPFVYRMLPKKYVIRKSTMSGYVCTHGTRHMISVSKTELETDDDEEDDEWRISY